LDYFSGGSELPCHMDTQAAGAHGEKYPGLWPAASSSWQAWEAAPPGPGESLHDYSLAGLGLYLIRSHEPDDLAKALLNSWPTETIRDNKYLFWFKSLSFGLTCYTETGNKSKWQFLLLGFKFYYLVLNHNCFPCMYSEFCMNLAKLTH
jgi:hypothetical protein